MPKLSVFQVVILGVFAALAISGVLIFAFVVNGNSSAALGPVTIWGTLDKGAFNSVIDEVSRGDDRFEQVSYVELSEDTFMNELTEALAVGGGPDLFIIRQDYAVREAEKAYPTSYEQLSGTEYRNTFVEATEPFLLTRGITAIPLVADPLVLYWNRDMFASAGYANPPQYWDEISGMTQKMTKKDDSGQITKSTVAFGEFRNVTHAKDIVSMLLLQAGNSIVERTDSGGFRTVLDADQSKDKQTTESAIRFYTEFADPSKSIYSWNRALPESAAAFAAGDLALYIGYASERDDIRRRNPNLNFAVAAVPQIRSSERPIDIAQVYGIATSRNARNYLGAVTVASRLASADASAALGSALGMSSARRDVLGASTGDLVGTQVILSRTWVDPDPEGSDVVFRSMIENVTSGALRLSEAISRAERELAQLF